MLKCRLSAPHFGKDILQTLTAVGYGQAQKTGKVTGITSQKIRPCKERIVMHGFLRLALSPPGWLSATSAISQRALIQTIFLSGPLLRIMLTEQKRDGRLGHTEISEDTACGTLIYPIK
jgi:hypothetical protein